MSLLSVTDLAVRFGASSAVDGVSFDVEAGECVAIVGQSGSGKSVTARALLGLSAGTVSGTVAFDGENVARMPAKRVRRLRGADIGFVSQGALVALDPLRPVGREIADALALHTRLAATARSARVIELLEAVGMPEPALRARQRPDELSGGLRQRAVIASAIAAGPRLLIADEPTTALDSTVARGIVDLLARLRDEGTAVLLISHDLDTVREIASRVLVMRDGVVVEHGPTADVLASPRHPYTRALIAAIPAGVPRHTPLAPVVGTSGVESPNRPGRPRAAASVDPTPEFPTTALEARGLVKTFGERLAVDGVHLRLGRGRTLGIVGESGSGKTTLARILLALETADAGEVTLLGEPWSGVAERERRARRPLIAAVYQDALSSFDPRWTVQRILADASPRGAAGVPELLARVGLPAAVARRRPRLLSGGQQQRVAIARAIATNPVVLVCDEPVSSLDVSSQALVLDLLDGLQTDLGMSLVFISHDLAVVEHMSDDVLVMHDGRVVESGVAGEVFASPQHEYTRELVTASARR